MREKRIIPNITRGSYEPKPVKNNEMAAVH